VLSYLRSIELTDVSIDANVALAKQKQTNWCLVPKFLYNYNFSRRRLDVCHTSTHGVALVRI